MKEIKIDINKNVFDMALGLYGSKEKVEEIVNKLIIEEYNKSKKSLLLGYIRDLKSIIDFIISDQWTLKVDWMRDVIYSGNELQSNEYLNFKIKVPNPTLWKSTIHKFEIFIKETPEEIVTTISVEVLNNKIISVNVLNINMLDFDRKFNLAYECPLEDELLLSNGLNSSLIGIKDQIWETFDGIFKTKLNAI